MNTSLESTSQREIITYQFQPDQRFDTIKRAIIKRYKQNLPTKNLATKNSPIQDLATKLSFGGLPSPPIEERPRLSSKDIKERIKVLQDEKHKLFQMIKQLVEQEKIKEQQKLRQQEQEQLEKQEQRMTKRRKKTRWSPPEHPIYFYEQQQASYYYPSKTQQPYSRLPPPYSR